MSRVRFHDLETMDMGFYRCEANNGIETISSETVIKIHPGNKRQSGQLRTFEVFFEWWHNEDALITDTFQLFQAS